MLDWHSCHICHPLEIKLLLLLLLLNILTLNNDDLIDLLYMITTNRKDAGD